MTEPLAKVAPKQRYRTPASLKGRPGKSFDEHKAVLTALADFKSHNPGLTIAQCLYRMGVSCYTYENARRHVMSGRGVKDLLPAKSNEKT